MKDAVNWIFMAIAWVTMAAIVIGLMRLMNMFLLQEAVQISEFMQGVVIGVLAPLFGKVSKIFKVFETV